MREVPCVTPDGRAIANVYDAMSKAAVQYNDNILFQDDNRFDFRQEMLRVDYQPSGARTYRLPFWLDREDVLGKALGGRRFLASLASSRASRTT